ncbi:DUF977 family protein [Escherichia coli]|uniref:DUF977 family protein n=1 Tax=Escherichia coli TaxID=562 RepID=UPI003D9BB174
MRRTFTAEEKASVFELWKNGTGFSEIANIWSSPDGEIRRYDSRLNIICRECRKSEVMQRILAFYQGNFQDVAQ